MKRHTATCGHKIEYGISCSIDDGQMSRDGHRCVTYGTYCAQCLFDYYQEGWIENKELNEFIELIIKWADNSEPFKNEKPLIHEEEK